MARHAHALPFVLPLLLLSPALAQDRVFMDEDVERAKAFWVANATGANGTTLDCLLTLNEGMRRLFDDRGLRLGDTVDKTMVALENQGRARGAIVCGFNNAEGKPTTGVTEPAKLRTSVWQTLIANAGASPGWYVFGFSPLDGNHSVVLALDLHDPAAPQVYWADQWSTKGGFKLYPDAVALDGEIERLTASWWRSKLAEKGVKFKTDAKVYPLIPLRSPAPNLEARVQGAPRLNLRTSPEVASGNLLKVDGRQRFAKKGETYKVLARQGQWVKLALPEGGEAWAHGGFLKLIPIVVDSAGLSGAIDPPAAPAPTPTPAPAPAPTPTPTPNE